MSAQINFSHRLAPVDADDTCAISKNLSAVEFMVDRLAGILHVLYCTVESGSNVPNAALLSGAIDAAKMELEDIRAALSAHLKEQSPNKNEKIDGENRLIYTENLT